MKILVTGSAGFIGMHACKQLISQGHDVVGLDNFNDYYFVQLKEDRNSEIIKYATINNYNFKLVRIDISNLDELDKLFLDEKFDLVCNLAAQAGVRYSLINPYVYVKSNLEGFVNILECCRKYNVKKFIYASSSSVYGGNVKVPFSEMDRVDNPVSLYAATKKSNELMAHTYSHLFDIQTIGLRFFTVYGPWGRPDMALWLFTEAMLNNKEINVYNNGNMMRDFTYIDDIVSGISSCVNNSEKLSKCEVFNIGNCNSEKLMHVIDVLGNTLNITPKINFLPMQLGDVPATYADITLINEKLGFKPTTSIEDGIPKFVNWYLEFEAGNY